MTTAVGALLVAIVAFVAAPVSDASAAFGDHFGAAPINGHPAATESVPALPGESHAFWAGTCNTASDGEFGDEMGPEGGLGIRPDTVLAPNGAGGNLLPPPFGPGQQVPVPAPETPDHCIDWGAVGIYVHQQDRTWQRFPYGIPGGFPFPIESPEPNKTDYAPSWRLPPVTQAGAHPDGTTMFSLRRNTEGVGTTPGRLDGSLDNIVVDLPPGFVANPNAVPKCSAEQFAATPLDCPPEAQIGILRLYMESIGGVGAANLGAWGYDATHPVYNLEPREGRVAEVGFGYASGFGAITVRLEGKPRTNDDHGVTAFTGQVPSALAPITQSITLWGVPWARANDLWRAPRGLRPDPTRLPPALAPCVQQPGSDGLNYIPPGGLPPSCRQSYDPTWGDMASERAVKPFLTNETDCNPTPTVRLAMDSFQNPGPQSGDGDPILEGHPSSDNWRVYTSTPPPVTGCADLDFGPDIEFEPTSTSADGPTGLKVDLSLPQNNDPKGPGGDALSPPAPGAGQAAIDAYVDAATEYWRSPEGRAVAHLKDTVVTLPQGVSVNPAAAAGLRGCSDAEIGLRELGNPPKFNNGDPFDGDRSDGVECPAGSKIGTVRVETPLLDEVLTGEMVLGEPKSTDPQSGEMLRLFLVVRNRERGLLVKIYGSTVADPQSGQLTTRFLNNPELPFDRLSLEIEGGSRGLLALPQQCGSAAWSSTFTPWSAAYGAGGQSVRDGGAFPVTSNCGFGFAPSFAAGAHDRESRATGTFSLRLGRRDGEHWLSGLTTRLPEGLLAAVKHVELCTNEQADAGACPTASQIGVVDASAGSGTPFWLELPGRVYLTEGYKGGAYGLAVDIRPVAGPFRGAMELSPIIVRQALHVDRRTAQVTAVSDPFPLIHHGIPLRVRDIAVRIDRDGFMLNPSDCSPKQVDAEVLSARGAAANVASPFRASGCKELRFKPRLRMRLVGRKQRTTGGHPAVRARVRQRGVPEAGIQRAVVRLPRSLALDPDNAQGLCEFEDGTKPDLENHCPEESIVGRVRAVSPLLKRPLVGDVYFVKNVRIDPETGEPRRTLPMIIAALRGEIAINVRGESDVDRRDRLVSTFVDLPDAPISRFNLNIKGGRNGIITVTRTRGGEINLCRGRQVARADFDGHNGRDHDLRVRMRTPCPRRLAPAKVCRKRTDSRRALRRCVARVKENRARRRANRRAARRSTGRRDHG